MRKLYRLVDKYEGDIEVIYEDDNLTKVTAYAKYYDREVVDGECYLDVYVWNGYDKYKLIKNWRY